MRLALFSSSILFIGHVIANMDGNLDAQAHSLEGTNAGSHHASPNIQASASAAAQAPNNTSTDPTHVSPDNTSHSAPDAESKAATDTEEYYCIPKDNTNTTQLNDIAAYLVDLTASNPTNPTNPAAHLGLQELRDWNGRLVFRTLFMTEDQKKRLEQHPGVDEVGLNPKTQDYWVTHPRRQLASTEVSRTPTNESYSFPSKVAQTVGYTTQLAAVPGLVSISQPITVDSIGHLSDYVYENHGGNKAWIYNVGDGLADTARPAEWPAHTESIFTPMAEALKYVPHVDYGSGHSTCVADKAVGHDFGVAKNAMLVSVVRAQENVNELVSSIFRIIRDLNEHPERRKHSVVTITSGRTPHQISPGLQRVFKSAIEQIMNMDVPVVCAAGNDAQNNPNIVDLPQVWATPDYPLIVVGSANAVGERSPFSQYGPQLTISAMGYSSSCWSTDKTDGPTTGLWGTSFSTPMVAGQIANLLSYDTIPAAIDMSDRKVARSFRDFFLTNSLGRAQRTPNGMALLYNGVTKLDNPSLAPEKVCNNLGANMYAARFWILNAITNGFCPSAAAQGGMAGKYNTGSMEEVVITAWHTRDSNWQPTLNGCRRFLIDQLLDGCDPMNVGNPRNVKGGGYGKVGYVEWSIRPQRVRAPANLDFGAGCRISFGGLLTDKYEVWGRGFLTQGPEDSGAGLRDLLDDSCADQFHFNTWSFKYGLGDNQREWTAKFQADLFSSSCIQDALTKGGAPSGTTCSRFTRF